MSSRVMFGEIVTEVRCARSPVDEELALFGPVFDPIKLHVDCFGSFLFYGVICKTVSGGVINLHWCRWLGMTHFFQGCSNGDCFLPICVGGGDFGFGG